MASKTEVAHLEFDGLGRRYEEFVHQGSCTALARVITNPSFAVGRLN